MAKQNKITNTASKMETEKVMAATELRGKNEKNNMIDDGEFRLSTEAQFALMAMRIKEVGTFKGIRNYGVDNWLMVGLYFFAGVEDGLFVERFFKTCAFGAKNRMEVDRKAYNNLMKYITEQKIAFEITEC